MAELKQILYEGGSGEIVEKKSRFIASVAPVTTEQEALDFIAAKKKEYWDARHNCYAYIIGSNQEIMRCSDDGEPAQTAGRPMLDVLLSTSVYNIVVVVTRYFGGVLLGTGGLVRAYQGAVQEGLSHCVLLEQCHGRLLSITTDYNGYGKIDYLLREQQIPIQETDFGADVRLNVIINDAFLDSIPTEIANVTNGTALLNWGDFVNYGNNSEKIIIFEKNT